MSLIRTEPYEGLWIPCPEEQTSTTYEEIVPGSIDLLHPKDKSEFVNVPISAKLFEIYDRVILETRTWQEFECEEVAREGKGDWKGFYNVPRDQKVDALSAAVKGIGKARAEAIGYSKANYFNPKPRSWNEFKKEIRRIENQRGERDDSIRGIYNDVVARYGSENSQNVGYASEGVDCRWVTRTEPVWVTV